jgi:hypothetical protein
MFTTEARRPEKTTAKSEPELTEAAEATEVYAKEYEDAGAN